MACAWAGTQHKRASERAPAGGVQSICFSALGSVADKMYPKGLGHVIVLGATLWVHLGGMWVVWRRCGTLTQVNKDTHQNYQR